jgi:gliding motility-associated-like protein
MFHGVLVLYTSTIKATPEMRQFRCALLVGLLLSLLCSQATGFNLYRICQSNDTFTLNFNPVTDTCGEFFSYEVYWQANPGQPFQLVETLQEPDLQQFEHVPGNADNLDEWQYYIKATTACPGAEAYTDTIGVDKERPASLELDSLTVENGNIQLGWSPHPNPAIKGYTIYYVDGGQTRKIDQILGHKNTSYTENDISAPDGQVEKFRLGAFDSCMNESTVSINTHTSMFLQEPDVDTCERRIELNWSAYEGWDVAEYGVVAAKDGRDPQIVERVDGSKTEAVIDTLEGGFTYDVSIRAFKADGDATSTSNLRSLRLGSAGSLGFAYLRAVSVVDSVNEVRFSVENVAGLQSITVLKGPNRDELSPFRSISPVTGSDDTIKDTAANPQAEETYYQVRSKGLCANSTESSNVARNIVLNVKAIDDSIRLNWQAYEVFNSGVENYRIQRQTQAGDVENWETLATVGADELEYTKLNEFRDSEERRTCFRIQAIEGNNNEFGYQGEALSNVVCLFNDPVVYIPNAIVLGGVNSEFKPQGRFIDYEASSMTIYNRWGEEIYSSDNLNQGWDGTSDGEVVQQGEYFYKMTIVGIDQTTSTESGTLTVIR